MMACEVALDHLAATLGISPVGNHRVFSAAFGLLLLPIFSGFIRLLLKCVGFTCIQYIVVAD